MDKNVHVHFLSGIDKQKGHASLQFYVTRVRISLLQFQFERRRDKSVSGALLMLRRMRIYQRSVEIFEREEIIRQ